MSLTGGDSDFDFNQHDLCSTAVSAKDIRRYTNAIFDVKTVPVNKNPGFSHPSFIPTRPTLGYAGIIDPKPQSKELSNRSLTSDSELVESLSDPDKLNFTFPQEE